MTYVIRDMKEAEYPLLNGFLYDAIFVPEGVCPPPKEIIYKDELQVYIKDFGDKGDDCALVAEADGSPIGAVWARIMDDYGHVDDDTPSLAISVKSEYRGRGIGSALLREMLNLLKKRGYKSVSLAVQKVNFAVRMYKKANFVTVDENAEEYIMVCKLS